MHVFINLLTYELRGLVSVAYNKISLFSIELHSAVG